jgi:hypothetical protein
MRSGVLIGVLRAGRGVAERARAFQKRGGTVSIQWNFTALSVKVGGEATSADHVVVARLRKEPGRLRSIMARARSHVRFGEGHAAFAAPFEAGTP